MDKDGHEGGDKNPRCQTRYTRGDLPTSAPQLHPPPWRQKEGRTKKARKEGGNHPDNPKHTTTDTRNEANDGDVTSPTRTTHIRTSPGWEPRGPKTPRGPRGEYTHSRGNTEKTAPPGLVL